MLIIKPNKIKTLQQYDSFIEWKAVGLIGDIINRFTTLFTSRPLCDLLPWGFYREKVKKFTALSLRTSTEVTFAILDAA